MPGRLNEDDLLHRIADLERRLRTLESTPRNPNISTKAFGIQADQVATVEDTSGGLYEDLATVGPEITITIRGNNTGRVLLFYGATISDGSGAGFANGSEVVFSQDGDDVTGDSILISERRLTLDIDENGWVFSLSRSILIEDLSPGEHTFKLMYNANSDATHTVNFGNRFIIGLPIA